jgi:[ribosomal protein S5]-alanine N-acetyltransferase
MTGAGGSGRVFLRLLARGDADAFLAAVHRSTELHRPWSYPPDTLESFIEYTERDPARRVLGVFRSEDDELCGVFTISQIFYGPFQSAYLGYYAFGPFAGHGYMREGLELVLRYAFDELGLHRLQASIQPENHRSIALVAAAGFRNEGLSERYLKIGGVWRDHEHWAILADDHRKP